MSLDENVLDIVSISKKPKVNAANEFLEIATDFTNPLELVREAISNAFDAEAQNIHLDFSVIDVDGEDTFQVLIKDDGQGMNEDDLETFFDLGNSLRRRDNNKIGEKGHGTKVYFNSKRITVQTVKDGKYIKAEISDIFKYLNRGELPEYHYTIEDSANAPIEKGTQITILGYNQSRYNSFSHDQIKDYIYWKTKFGSVEQEVGIDKYEGIKLYLRGLDYNGAFEELTFGHKFPDQSKNANKLYEEYLNDAPHHFCKKWVKTGSLPNYPNIKYEAIFYVEGKNVKYSYINIFSILGIT